MRQIVHAHVRPQPEGVGEGVHFEAGDIKQLEANRASHGGQFGGAQEPRVLMGTAWQKAQQVFRADDGQPEGLGGAVECGQKHAATRTHQGGEGRDDGRRVWHVFEHFHAAHHVVARGLRCGQLFGGCLHILHCHASFQRVKPCHLQCGSGEIDASGSGAAKR